jgi:hypothetical protein
MVAAQAFIDRAEKHVAATRRAQLQIPPLPERTSISAEEVREAVEAIYKEIEDRALRPVIEAPTIEAADALAIRGFEIFIDLWPAAIGALLPWLQEHPDQLGRLTGAARDLWRSEEAARKLGEDACEWFAAAQSARQAMATSSSLGTNQDALVRHTLLADFAFMLGGLLIQAPDAKPAEGLALSVAKLAHTSATNAFALATQHLYADPAP